MGQANLEEKYTNTSKFSTTFLSKAIYFKNKVILFLITLLTFSSKKKEKNLIDFLLYLLQLKLKF